MQISANIFRISERLGAGVCVVVVGFSFWVSAIAQCPNPKADPRVQITSPVEGQYFAPGDAVSVTVRSTGRWTDGFVSGAPGAGPLEGRGFDGSSFHVQFRIPPDYSAMGPLVLVPSVIDASGHPIEGMCLTVIVRRNDTPISIQTINSVEYLFPIGNMARVYVTAHYAKGVDADLSSSTVGTVYESSDAHVVTVDVEGNVKSTGLGTAVVTARNAAQSTFVSFVVEDPAQPLPPQDLTAQVSFTKSPLIEDAAATAKFRYPVHVQMITITNATRLPIIGPLYLVVNDLPQDVRLYNGPNLLPAPRFYLRLHPKDGLIVQPGDSVTSILQLVLPRSAEEPHYGLGLIRSRGEPRRRDLPEPAIALTSPAIQIAKERRALQANQCIDSDAAVPKASGAATITNHCPYPVQYTLCYRGAGGAAFDCKNPPTGVDTQSLAAGETRPLPQYQRNLNTGLLIIACKGASGEVTPLLNHDGKTGCY